MKSRYAFPGMGRLPILGRPVSAVLPDSSRSPRCPLSSKSNDWSYDLLNVLALPDEEIDRSYAMAIGDAFSYDDLNVDERTGMAAACGLPARLVASELTKATARVQEALQGAAAEVLLEGALPDVVELAGEVTTRQCIELAAMAKGIRRPALRRRQTTAPEGVTSS